MSEIEFLSEQIEKISKQMINDISNIIENKLKEVCETYKLSPEKVILQCYPEGTYSVAIVVSQFKIDHEFTYKPTQT